MVIGNCWSLSEVDFKLWPVGISLDVCRIQIFSHPVIPVTCIYYTMTKYLNKLQFKFTFMFYYTNI